MLTKELWRVANRFKQRLLISVSEVRVLRGVVRLFAHNKVKSLFCYGLEQPPASDISPTLVSELSVTFQWFITVFDKNLTRKLIQVKRVCQALIRSQKRHL